MISHIGTHAAVVAAFGSLAGAAPRIVADSDRVLSGDRIPLRIVDAEPGSLVIVSAQRYSSRDDAIYRGAGVFRADGEGSVDPFGDAPITGTWLGSDEAGIVWSMGPDPDADQAAFEGRSWKDVRFTIDADGDGTAEDEAWVALERGVEGLVETPLGDAHPGAFLLRPPGDEPLPVIIALGGSEGGDSTARWFAPSMASRGYAVVGLPYYSPAWGDQPQDVPGLPRAFAEIPLDTLESVRDWIRARPDLDGGRIGLWGVSKGAEFVLAASSRLDGFAAVAAIVPSDVIWEGWGRGWGVPAFGSFSWRGKGLPFVPYLGMGEEFAKRQRGQAVRLRLPHDAGRLANPDRVEAARIRVEDIDEPVFVVGGDDDDVWDSGGMARNIAERRAEAGLETVLIVDPAAGHGLSGDPYTNLSAADARVRSEAFTALLTFFSEHLGAGGGSTE